MKRTSATEASSALAKKSKAESDEDEELILPTKAPGAANGKPTTTSSIGKPTPKLASIFQPRTAASSSSGTNGSASSSSVVKLQWLDPIGPAKTCLHGVYGDPQPNAKVAFYDLDGTIVRPKGGKTFPSKTDEYDFDFLFSSPSSGLGGPSSSRSVISRIRQQHREEGFAVVIITNQKQTQYSAKNGLATWKKKMAHIAAAIDVPMRVFAALGDDVYRKPRLGSWEEFTLRWNGGVEVDKEGSFFVGDAAGRKKYRDHQDTDLKWALNAGIQFFTPEEYFLGKEKEYAIPTRPWSPSTLPPTSNTLKGLVVEPEDEMHTVNLADLESDETAMQTILGERDGKSGTPEIVLFVGPPASGKTYLFNRIFARNNYVHINQDTLRTRDKCLRVVADTLSSTPPQSCVVDNTNRDRATRKHYIELAQKLGVAIRCVYFDVPKHVCVHNNHFRAHHGPTNEMEEKRGVLPFTAIESWFKDRQVPSKKEGFEGEVVRVVWGWNGGVEGREEVERKWKMYYH